MRNCGNCDCCERECEDLVCANDLSEYFGDFVDESHSCDAWDGSEEDESSITEQELLLWL